MSSKKLVINKHNVDKIKDVAMRHVFGVHYGLDGKLLLLKGLEDYMQEKGYDSFSVEVNDIEIVYDSTDE